MVKHNEEWQGIGEEMGAPRLSLQRTLRKTNNKTTMLTCPLELNKSHVRKMEINYELPRRRRLGKPCISTAGRAYQCNPDYQGTRQGGRSGRVPCPCGSHHAVGERLNQESFINDSAL